LRHDTWRKQSSRRELGKLIDAAIEQRLTTDGFGGKLGAKSPQPPATTRIGG
jgi:hypothetical protein